MPKMKIAGAFFILVGLVFFSAPVGADDTTKADNLWEAATVLRSMLDANSVPASLLAKADCVIILPSVKKGAFIVGGTGGRGPMICRGGKDFIGRWGAPPCQHRRRQRRLASRWHSQGLRSPYYDAGGRGQSAGGQDQLVATWP